MARLKIQFPDGPSIERDLMEDVISIGRTAENLLQIEEGSVSSRHAELTKLDTGGWLLRDLNSTNGTFVNDQQIDEALLKDGDTVRFGKIEAVFLESAQSYGERGGEAADAPVQESAEALLVATTSIRPAKFVSSSPFPRVESHKSKVQTAMIAAGILSLILGIVSAGLALLSVKAPQFPAP